MKNELSVITILIFPFVGVGTQFSDQTVFKKKTYSLLLVMIGILKKILKMDLSSIVFFFFKKV